METKRNDIIEFAIGSKIVYNDKLYEVVEQKFCDECSIATICANSDKTDANPTKVLSKTKRLSVFGECSGIVRSDSKSVVFKEISKTKEKDVYNVGTLYKTNNELMPIQIDLPKGYVIDKEHSDLDKRIIRFKNKWLSLEQMYNTAKATNYRTCFSEIKDSTGDKTCEFREKLIALANLMDIARYFNGGWEYDVTKENVGYAIAYYKFVEAPHYSVCKIENSVYTYYGNPVFKNEADAQYVIDNPNFREVLDNIFKV